MEVKVLSEHGYREAISGLSLTLNTSYEDAQKNSLSYVKEDNPYSKFLEMIDIWVIILAPRYWWQQFDKYRIGVTKQAKGTRHIFQNREFLENDFEGGINEIYLKFLNSLVRQKQFDIIRKSLPESFLQKKIIKMDYKTLRRMYKQRKDAKDCGIEWEIFLDEMLNQIRYPYIVTEHIT